MHTLARCQEGHRREGSGGQGRIPGQVGQDHRLKR